MHHFECLKQSCTIGEAIATEMALEEAGIPCRVFEGIGGIWGSQASAGSARVFVAREDLERATQMLQTDRDTDTAVCLGDTDEAEEDYWNAPEAFAPFEGDDGKRPDEVKFGEFAAVASFWLLSCLYFLAVFGTSVGLGYLLGSDILGS